VETEVHGQDVILYDPGRVAAFCLKFAVIRVPEGLEIEPNSFIHESFHGQTLLTTRFYARYAVSRLCGRQDIKVPTVFLEAIPEALNAMGERSTPGTRYEDGANSVQSDIDEIAKTLREIVELFRTNFPDQLSATANSEETTLGTGARAAGLSGRRLFDRDIIFFVAQNALQFDDPVSACSRFRAALEHKEVITPFFPGGLIQITSFQVLKHFIRYVMNSGGQPTHFPNLEECTDFLNEAICHSNYDRITKQFLLVPALLGVKTWFMKDGKRLTLEVFDSFSEDSEWILDLWAKEFDRNSYQKLTLAGAKLTAAGKLASRNGLPLLASPEWAKTDLTAAYQVRLCLPQFIKELSGFIRTVTDGRCQLEVYETLDLLAKNADDVATQFLRGSEFNPPLLAKDLDKDPAVFKESSQSKRDGKSYLLYSFNNKI
jgi:hypothetical protein